MNNYKSMIVTDLSVAESVAKKAFASTTDSDISQWLSFDVMHKIIAEDRGVCLLALDGIKNSIGMIYAQQENPVNGLEGTEKWVIVILAVDPDLKGKGIGSFLLNEMEGELKNRGAKKFFVYTNKDDEDIVSFYKKNGFIDAGWIKDYQYGKNNSAVFLLKYL